MVINLSKALKIGQQGFPGIMCLYTMMMMTITADALTFTQNCRNRIQNVQNTRSALNTPGCDGSRY